MKRPIAAMLLVLLVTHSADAVVFDLKKVVSDGDVVSGMGNQVFPLGPPAIDGDDLGFFAFTDQGRPGYFIYKADSDTILPAGVYNDALTGPASLGSFNRLERFGGFPSMSGGELTGWHTEQHDTPPCRPAVLRQTIASRNEYLGRIPWATMNRAFGQTVGAHHEWGDYTSARVAPTLVRRRLGELF
jgi:hypothetical protein